MRADAGTRARYDTLNRLHRELGLAGLFASSTSRPRSDMPFSRTLISGARKRYHMALMHSTLWCLPCGAQRMRSTPGWSPRACLTTWIARSSTFSAPAPIWIDSALFREALPGQAKGL